MKEEGVIENVLKAGTELALGLIKQAEEAEQNDLDASQEEIVTEEIITEEVEEYVDVVTMPSYGYSYWDPYWDPYYVSPIWLLDPILW